MVAPTTQVVPELGTEPWVQFGLAPAGPAGRALYGELAVLARTWLTDGVVDGFFFMHKPPGLRIRFRPAAHQEEVVRAGLRGCVRQWRAAALIGQAEPGRYEPEEHRFGGPRSMAHVHRLFTVDAATWLDFHSLPPQAPPWALSLAMLRPVLDAMGLTGSGADAVWAAVAAAGRVVPAGVPGTEVARPELRRWWRNQDELHAALPGPVRALAARHAEQVREGAAEWAAELRPEDTAPAVGWYVVFHWNRAALTFGRQALLATVLRGGDED